MKRSILIALLLFALVGLTQNAYSQLSCTSPSYLVVESLPYVPGCESISVYYCIYCDPTDPNMEVTILRIDGGCDVNLFDFYYDYAQEYLMENYDLLCPNTWVPCDPPQTNEIKIKLPMCWYYDDQIPVNFYACSPASYCVETYKVCRSEDYAHWTLTNTEIEGPGCDDILFPDNCAAFQCGRSTTPPCTGME